MPEVAPVKRSFSGLGEAKLHAQSFKRSFSALGKAKLPQDVFF